VVGFDDDQAAIPVGAPPDKWSAEIPYHPAYFKLRESRKTFKARIQATNLMDPRNKTIARANGLNTKEGDEFVNSDDDFGERILEWDDDQAPQDFDTPLSDNGRDNEEAFVSTRPPFDFETQRAILLGSAVAKETSKDFVGSRKIKYAIIFDYVHPSREKALCEYFPGSQEALFSVSVRQGVARHHMCWRLCF